MRRYALLLVIVLGVSTGAWADLVTGFIPYHGAPYPGSVFDRLDPGFLVSSGGPTGIEVVQKPWSTISSLEEGISEVRITPTKPTSDDEVFAIVSGWKPKEDYVPDYADVTTAGSEIWLDLYWHERPPVPTIPLVTPKKSGLINSQLTGAGASGGFQTAQSIPVNPVTQYILTPFDGTRFQVKESLGTFSPGTYTLHVTSHDPVPGSASKTFIVREAASIEGFPWPGNDGPLAWLLIP